MKRVGKPVCLILLSLLVPALCVTTAWADVWDPCDSTNGPGSYQNLSSPGQNYIRWSDPPDRSYLCQQNNRRAASAVYRCSGAREVTVAIYSRYGSYAGYSGGELVRGGDELPLRYQSSTGEVYCDGRRMVYDADLRKFVFLEEEGRPSGLAEYGLSVYCSGDGSDYTRASAQLISAWQEGPDSYWYEVYRADLKEGTRYLRLVLTDQSSIEILGREERYQFETVGGLSLASVEIIEEGAGEPIWEDGWGMESSRSSAGGGEAGFSWEDWEAGGSATGGLPSYQPGEEEGPESLPWGPDEDPEDGGPAFPEETGDREGEESQSPEEEPSGDGSSTGGGPASSSKAQTQKGGSQSLIGQNISPGEEPQAPAKAGEPAPVLRWEVPLWRRMTDPDAMTMLIIALTLIMIGVRVLLEGSGRDEYGKMGEPAEREEQEARYARYMSPDSGPRNDGGRERKDRRTVRRGRTGRDDEDREDPEI